MGLILLCLDLLVLLVLQRILRVSSESACVWDCDPEWCESLMPFKCLMNNIKLNKNVFREALLKTHQRPWKRSLLWVLHFGGSIFGVYNELDFAGVGGIKLCKDAKVRTGCSHLFIYGSCCTQSIFLTATMVLLWQHSVKKSFSVDYGVHYIHWIMFFRLLGLCLNLP